MTEIYRTRYNQYQAIVEPVTKWLQRQGVNFFISTFVSGIEFKASVEEITANSLQYVRDGKSMTVEVEADDLVLVTNGSQTADLSFGAMTAPAILRLEGRSWALWKRLAHGRHEFGNPEAFFGEPHLRDTAWLTFTVTTTNSTFHELMTEFTGSEPGRGGHMTFKDLNWLITLQFPQPHFLEQPPGVKLWWGYALYPDRMGNFIKKPMLQCSGLELKEVLWHLGFVKDTERVIGVSTCIPCIALRGQCLASAQANRSTASGPYRFDKFRLYRSIRRSSTRNDLHDGILRSISPRGGLNLAETGCKAALRVSGTA